MKFGKIRAFIAVCILAGTVLTGCSGNANIITYNSEDGVKAPEESPVISKKKIKAALLLPSDPETGACMSQAHADAFMAAASEMNVEAKVFPAASTDTVKEDTKDYNVIFGAGYGYMNPLDKLAKENTKKLYACFGGYKYNSSNYSNYYTAIYEAQYLAGVVAGSNTKSGKIGIVSEYSSEYPDSAAEINSFTLGAKAVNPDIKVHVYTLGSRVNASNANGYTQILMGYGCDVISIQCDTAAPAETIKDKEVFFIGYGSDMSKYGDKCLTSVVWNLKDYYKSAFSAASDGTWNSGNYYGTLKDGAVTLAPLSALTDEKTAPRIESASELIKNDLLEIFSNRRVVFDIDGKATVTNAALIDNKGNTMVSEDGTSYFIYSGNELKQIEASAASSDKLASASMNYLVAGIMVGN